MKTALNVFFIFLKLGLTSFGGPVAHLGYFRREFVVKRKWLEEANFVELLALCQFLPGPASSQLGMAIGYQRAGVIGSLAAWFGFTLPSALLMLGFAFWMPSPSSPTQAFVIHCLKILAVAIVLDAVLSLGLKFCRTFSTQAVAVVSLLINLALQSGVAQIVTLALAGCVSILLFQKDELTNLSKGSQTVSLERNSKSQKRFAIVNLILFAIFLVGLPALAAGSDSAALKLFNGFFRAGALVFGGGHVVLPLLKAEVLNHGFITQETFMAGYGAAQAMPGPLFSFATYLGAVTLRSPSGAIGAGLATVAIFLPSFFLIFGVLPFWNRLRSLPKLRSALIGLNAAVVGLLAAAFVNPVWASAIMSYNDLLAAAVCFAAFKSFNLYRSRS